MRVMGFVNYRGITFILIGMSAIQRVCLFEVCRLVPFHLIAKISSIKKCFSDYRSSNVVEIYCTIKTKVLAEEANS